jgi:hypothetical protein
MLTLIFISLFVAPAIRLARQPKPVRVKAQNR